MEILPLTVLLIGISAIAVFFKSPLFSLIAVIPSWHLAFTHTHLPFIAIFFGFLGLIHLFNSAYFLISRQ